MTNEQIDKTVERGIALGLLAGTVFTLLAMLRGHGLGGSVTVAVVVTLIVSMFYVMVVRDYAELEGEA